MKTLSSSEKRFLVGSVAAVTLLGGFGLLLSRGAKPSVQIAPHAPTPSPNGLNLYIASAASIIRVTPPVDPVNDTSALTLTPQQKASRYSLARRTQWERRSTKAWTLFEQAKAAESLQPVRRSVRSPLLINDALLRQLARDKTALSRNCILRNDWGSALRHALDDVELGHDAARGGGLIAALVGQAISAMGTKAAQRSVARFDAQGKALLDDIVTHLNATQAKAGAKRLETLISSGPALSETMRESKAVTQTQWLETWGEPGVGQNKLHALLRPQAQMLQEYSQVADKFIAEADKPYGAHTTWPSLKLPVIASEEFAPQKMTFNFVRSRVQEQTLLIRLALRAYVLEHGKPPAKLTNLVPSYLSQVPVDPFGKGEAWRYKAGTAWSVGPDGVDDGGRSVPTRPRFVPTDRLLVESKGDLPTRL